MAWKTRFISALAHMHSSAYGIERAGLGFNSTNRLALRAEEPIVIDQMLLNEWAVYPHAQEKSCNSFRQHWVPLLIDNEHLFHDSEQILIVSALRRHQYEKLWNE